MISHRLLLPLLYLSQRICITTPFLIPLSSNHRSKPKELSESTTQDDTSSLIPQTLTEMETDTEFQDTLQRLNSIGPKEMAKQERLSRRRALKDLGTPSFSKFIQDNGKEVRKRRSPKILQLNIGLYCNQACSHCHVESSPLRTEAMTMEHITQCLSLIKNTPSVTTLDITGGAPELDSNFRSLVEMARCLDPNLEIIDRCNLTVLQEPGQEDLAEFLKENKVRVVASLPCYSTKNVDAQRGRGVFERSIQALQTLNSVGYGIPSSPLTLDLVYNPGGAFLPPAQSKLEKDYKERLQEDFGIQFHNLFTITNMPIKRFADYLSREKMMKEYMELLVNSFNPGTVDNLMCLDTVSVGYDGKIYDCDFNQQLGYTLTRPKTIFDITCLDELSQIDIMTDNHCFGCTAGMGSS